MSCCENKDPLDRIYVPLSERLIQFGEDTYGEMVMDKYKYTHMWVFTFYSDIDFCETCQKRFTSMNKWFSDYGLFDDPIRNVKWVVEDEPEKNMIYKEMGFTKTPMHIFTDSDGKIIDIFTGFPTPEWLEKYILPLIRKGTSLL
jgi:hypothetical protein